MQLDTAVHSTYKLYVRFCFEYYIVSPNVSFKWFLNEARNGQRSTSYAPSTETIVRRDSIFAKYTYMYWHVAGMRGATDEPSRAKSTLGTWDMAHGPHGTRIHQWSILHSVVILCHFVDQTTTITNDSSTPTPTCCYFGHTLQFHSRLHLLCQLSGDLLPYGAPSSKEGNWGH